MAIPRFTRRQLQLLAGSTVALALSGYGYLRSGPVRVLGLGLGDARVPEIRIAELADPLDARRPLRVREKLRQRPKGLYAAPNGELAPAPPTEAHRARGFVITEASGEPCAPKDTGPGNFTTWKSASPAGFYSQPRAGAVDADGNFDLLIHFQGHDLAWLQFVQADVPMVMLGVRSERGMGWRSQLGGPDAYRHLVEAMEQTLGRAEGREVHARHVALGSWSGGYEAISTLLEQSKDVDADAVILLDGVHVARREQVSDFQLRPFVELAKRALAGEVFVFATHSSVVPDGYASTTESTHRWLSALSTRAIQVERRDPPGIPLIHAFSRGSLHVRGYAGGAKADHCAQLGLYPAALQALARWRRAH
ncbi:MAG: hypothetical protein KC776_16420 [Myxococcales bacterium]|nr:hypothetical protein [Myxococcales bacterium]MCB9578690.1 hypothetical protein [Polyangiaceae bacterium]